MKNSNTFMKGLMVKAMIIIAILIHSNGVVGQDWFDSDWQYRRPVNIENSSGVDLTEYQVQVLLDGSFDFTKVNPDGSDIRFTDDDGITLLPYWIETWDPGTTSANIWLKVPNIGITGSMVYMYYGNLSPNIPPPTPVETPPIGPYIKDPGNPIIPIGDPGNGESLLAENIVYDDVTGHYWLLFAAYRGGQTLGLAWSDNPTDPAAWNWDGYVISDANAPHILKYDGTWYIFYADRGHGGPPYPISVSSSPNVNGPYTYIGTMLTPSEAWESYRVDEPYVFQRNDGKWILMYMGEPGTTEEQIGYAEADDILGPYTKFAGNPCLAFGPPGSFDAGTIADPWVYEYYGVYYIGYTVSPTIHSPWQTAMAYTSDWQTFTKNGIILPLGSEYNSFRGAVTRIGDTYVFPYATKITSGSTYQMAIATQDVFMTPPSYINNSDAVFDFIDDFNGTTLDSYKWYFANGDITQTSVQNGLLTLTGETDYVKMLGASSFGMDYLMESRATHPDQGTQDLIAQLGFSDIQWNVIRIIDDFPSVTHWQRQAKIINEPDELFNMVQTADADWHTFRIYRNSPNIAGFQIDDNPIETTTGTPNTSVPTMELPPYLMSYGETNEFVIDWVRVRKWSGEEHNTSFGTEQNLSEGIDIALYNTACGKFEVRLKPDIDISNSSLSNIQFTIKWPTNTVNLINMNSDYGVTQQGPVYIEKDTNYAVFVSASVNSINWLAETEYSIFSFTHDQTGSGYSAFNIDDGEWSAMHNGSYYVELLGSDNTGVIYHQADNVYIGKCGRLVIKALLQGPYNTSTGLMNTMLNAAGELPLTQPYNISPWNYTGTESVTVMPSDVIDWVLLELRSAPEADSATSSTLISRQAALLLYDGTLAQTDGSSRPQFNTSELDKLFIIIYHRNHLGMMSATPGFQTPWNFYNYDFTTDITQAYGDGQKFLDTGVYGMIGGDANSDGIINLSDAIQIWIPQAGTAGYLNGDTNLDKQVNNPDKNDIWFYNFNQEIQVPD